MRFFTFLALTCIITPAWAAGVEIDLPATYEMAQLTREIKQRVPAFEGADEERARGKLVVRRQTGEFTAQELTSIRSVVSAHAPKVPSNPDAELTLAIQNATTVQELKDALLGKTRQGKVKAETP